MRSLFLAILGVALASCSSSSSISFDQALHQAPSALSYEQNLQYYFRTGALAAKKDLQKGILAYRDCPYPDGEDQNLIEWTYAKLLSEHGIQYNDQGEGLDIANSYNDGYNSIMSQPIEAKLGIDWKTRFRRQATKY